MRATEIIKKYGIGLILVLICIIFASLNPIFIKSSNILNILRQIAILGIVSVGLGICLITGIIDLTVGSLVGMSVIVCSKLIVYGFHPVIAILISLIIGIVIGAVNGFLVCNIGITSFIATLGMHTIVRGIIYVMTTALPVYGLPESFRFIGQGYIWFIPVPVIIMVVTFAVAWVYLNMTKHGRYIYGIGGNEEATRLSGVNVVKMKYLVLMVSAFLSSMAGIVLLSRLNSGQPRAGIGLEFDVITAVVLGGVSIYGGEGKLSGIVIGVLIMGVLSNGLVIVGVSEYYQMLIKGVVLIAAVGLDAYSQKQRSKSVDISDIESVKKNKLKDQ